MRIVLSPEELEQRRVTLVRNARKKDREGSTGLFGFNAEERAKFSAMGGSASKGVIGNRARNGETSRNERKGVHALTREQLQEASRRGYQSREDKWFGGEKINGMDEGEYLQYLAQQPEYQHDSGQYAGLPDRTKITNALNDVYHQGRTPRSVQDFFRKYI